MASDRYKYTEIKRNIDSNRVYQSTLYPTIELSDDDIYIFTKDGERLDMLADRYYGDVTLWWIIAQSNGIGKGTMSIAGGTRIRIPIRPNSVIDRMNELNKNR